MGNSELFLEKGVQGVAPAKIQQQIIEIIKKYKLEVEKPSQDLIATWTSE